MGTVAEMKKTYDIVMSVHGMGELVKVDLKTSRRNILFLAQLVKKSLTGKDKGGIEELISVMGPEVIKELSEIASECLTKGSLVDLNQKLEQL